MTQAEAREALLKGSGTTNSQFVTVSREALLVALGEQRGTAKETNDIKPAKP